MGREERIDWPEIWTRLEFRVCKKAAYLHDAGDAPHVALQQGELLGKFLKHAYLTSPYSRTFFRRILRRFESDQSGHWFIGCRANVVIMFLQRTPASVAFPFSRKC